MASLSVSIPPQVYKMLLLTGVGVAGYLLIKKGIHQAKSHAISNQFSSNDKNGMAARFAIRLFQAMFENDFFGLTEDEAAIFQVAKEMKAQNISFGLVAKKYKDKYRRDLLKNIQSALSPQEFDNFQNILTSPLGSIRLHEKLYLKQPTSVFNENFTKAIPLPATAKSIGLLAETVFVGTNSQRFYGFKNGRKKYYIPASKVILKSA
ncbi:MAG: hypothetical protein AAGI07_00250 [Bacteroidota bacterium]